MITTFSPRFSEPAYTWAMSDNDRGQSGPDPAHGSQPFYDASNTPDSFEGSPSSRFRGVHVDQVSGTARYIGGAGFSGDRDPEAD
jgi:hypothetical protein